MTTNTGAPRPPFDCLDFSSGSATGGVACAECPLLPDCQALTAAQLAVAQEIEIITLAEEVAERDERIAGLEAANETLERDKLQLLERLLNLRIDSLIDTSVTPEGLRDLLRHDAATREKISGRDWGVLRLDGRFVNYINRFGNLVGDRFLQAGGTEITTVTDGLVRQGERRTHNEPVAVEHRHEPNRRRSGTDREPGHSLQGDLICRQGGDEFSIIVYGATSDQLAGIAHRVQSQLTVTAALDRGDQGGIPFIASVGYAHINRLAPATIAQLDADDHWQTFTAVNAFADEGHMRAKARQYTEMWELVKTRAAASAQPLMLNQPDDRVVAETFLLEYFPNFIRNIRSILGQA